MSEMSISIEHYNKMAERLTELECREAERQWMSGDVPPNSERRVLCLTKTKKGLLNYVIGYYADGMWRCGMNSNVIAWMELPEPPEEEQS